MTAGAWTRYTSPYSNGSTTFLNATDDVVRKILFKVLVFRLTISKFDSSLNMTVFQRSTDQRRRSLHHFLRLIRSDGFNDGFFVAL